MAYDWDFGALEAYRGAILRGLLVTLQLTGLTIVIGICLGFLLGVLLRTRVLPVRWLLTACVDVIRSIPVLILLLCSNYFLPALLGMPSMEPFTIALVALSINLMAFTADVVRGAVSHVPTQEIDAARAVGLSDAQVLYRFTIPRVVQLSLPTLALLCIATAKNSALASAIAVYELTHTANLVITERMRTLEIYAVVAGIYIALIWPFSWLARRLETGNSPRRVDAQ
jgi:polar amino acid transport system permease protein